MKAQFVKLIGVSLLAAMLLYVSACDGVIEKPLDVSPTFAISSETNFQRADQIELALIGAYAGSTTQGALGLDNIFVPELLGSSSLFVDFVGTFNDPRDVESLTNLNSANPIAGRMWNNNYSVINRCNQVLANLAVVTDATERARTEGEALFLRAFCYFNLVRAFGAQYTALPTNLGVPIYTSPAKDINDVNTNFRGARNSVAEVYTRVETDLNRAIGLLDGVGMQLHPSGTVERAGSDACRALLARVILQRASSSADWTAAGNLAHAVINGGNYTLAADPVSAFGVDNNSESIFELALNAQNPVPGGGTPNFFAGAAAGGRGDMVVLNGRFFGTGTALDGCDFNAADIRSITGGGTTPNGSAMFYLSSGSAAPAGSRYTFKYHPNNPIKNAKLIRLAEMHLIRAECSVRTGTNIGGVSAQTDINTLRSRANAPTLGAAPTLAEVLIERNRELLLEGHFLYDRKRDGITTTLRGNPIGFEKYIMPIPQRETNLNPNLTQNPGY